MVDFSKNPPKNPAFASHLRKSTARKIRPNHKVFSTICWFYELQLTLGVSTAAAVRRKIEPDLAQGNKVIDQRWCDYRSGRHTPSAKIIAIAENHCPQSRHILKSGLWKALRLDRHPKAVALALLGSDSRHGDELLTWALRAPSQRNNDPRWLRKRCAAMIKHKNLESLAVLTICMRLASAADNFNLTVTFYHQAIRCLASQYEWLKAHGLTPGLLEHYRSAFIRRAAMLIETIKASRG